MGHEQLRIKLQGASKRGLFFLSLWGYFIILTIYIHTAKSCLVFEVINYLLVNQKWMDLTLHSLTLGEMYNPVCFYTFFYLFNTVFSMSTKYYYRIQFIGLYFSYLGLKSLSFTIDFD